MEINYAECLHHKYPSIEFTITNNDLQTLIIDNSIEIPSQEEFISIQNELNNQIPMNKLRAYRNFVLEITDKYSLPDYPHDTEDIRNEWIQFRKELRDITQTQIPQLDNDGNLVNVTWPTYPQNGQYP